MTDQSAPSSAGIFRWLIRIALILSVLAVLLGVGAWAGFRYFEGKAQGFVAEFEAQGYSKVEGKRVFTKEEIPEKRVYLAEFCRIGAGSSSDLAIVGQIAEVHGTVNGDLSFWGQTLLIKEDAVITGNLNAPWCQLIILDGRVDGNISGFYQLLIDEEGPRPPGR